MGRRPSVTDNKWARLLAYLTGLVNQKLLSRMGIWQPRIASSELTFPLVCACRIPNDPPSLRSASDSAALLFSRSPVSPKPDTILTWYRRLVAGKFNGSKFRTSPGLLHVATEVEALIVRFARENSGWGYDRIVGALDNLGPVVSDQTVGKIVRRYGIQPAPKRSQTTTWKDFIASHLDVLAGTDFFTAEVLTWRGLATYYVLFFIHLESRRVTLAGLTRHPTYEWMLQMAHNATDESSGFLRGQRYLLHDRNTKFSSAFLDVLRSSGIQPLALPPPSPNLNASQSAGWGSVRQECLSKLILLGEASLRRALTEFGAVLERASSLMARLAPR
jgi:putative transposase